MATELDDSFGSGDPIDPEHIKQLMAPLQDLEEGKAFYRDDSGAANAYEVDFSGSGIGNKNEISSYNKGLLIVFKAANANTGPSTLTVVGSAGSLASKPIVKPGNVALSANDIEANQMVAVVYNDAGTGRFEMIGAPAGDLSAADITTGLLALERGGTGADLSATGGSGQFLKQATAGGPVSVGDIAASDIASGQLPVARGGTGADLSATGGPGKFLKQPTGGGAITVGDIDAADISSGTLDVDRGGTGHSSYSQGDILVHDGWSLQKLPVGLDGQVLTADSGASEGVVWADPSGGGAGQSDLLFGDGMDGNVTITSDQYFWEHRYYHDLTITGGATLYMNGCKLYVKGTLTLDDGTIACNGGHADPSSGTTVGNPGNGTGGSVAWDSPGGSSGSVEQGESQWDWSAATFAARGGAGGEGSYGVGGSGEGSNSFGSERQFGSLPAILSGVSDQNTHWGGAHIPRFVRGGLGGGGGTGDGSSAAGGSGGGGAGVIWIAARHLSAWGTASLQAIGGNGGDAGGPDAGGGGGGGGGVIYLLTSDSSNPFTTDVQGGAGGMGGGGTGTNGGNGEDGFVIFRGNL